MEFHLKVKPEVKFRQDLIEANYVMSESERELNDIKNKIDNIPSDVWKKIRWYINYYDFIIKEPIINRAFFKYWEIIQKFDLLTEQPKLVMHLAEAPGGFIQGTNVYTRRKPKKRTVIVDGFMSVVKDTLKEPEIYTMSLDRYHPNYSKYNLPTYNEEVLKKNVHVIYGKDHTGDICNMENFAFFKSYIGSDKKMDIITADGGFDEGDDFNNKEILHFKLVLYSVYYAFAFQKEQGSFLLKIFDMFTDFTRELILLLGEYYTEVYIYKPLTSRPTNSEKYIVCKGFKGLNSSVLDNLEKVISEWDTTKVVSFVTSTPEARDEIDRISREIVSRQCSYLKSALSITSKQYFETLDSIKKIKLEKYLEWCKTYKFRLQ